MHNRRKWIEMKRWFSKRESKRKNSAESLLRVPSSLPLHPPSVRTTAESLSTRPLNLCKAISTSRHRHFSTSPAASRAGSLELNRERSSPPFTGRIWKALLRLRRELFRRFCFRNPVCSPLAPPRISLFFQRK